MDYPWWTNGATSGFEHDNYCVNTSYATHVSESQCGLMLCNYCGESHYNEQCPHVSTLDYMENDFTRVQTSLHDNNFTPRWNHEQNLSWDHNYFIPSYASYSFPPPDPFVEENTSIHEEKPTIEDMLQRILDNENEINAWTKKKFNEHALALQNLTFQLGQMTSTIESLKQEGIFNDIATSTPIEDEEHCEQFTIGSEQELLVAFDKFGGACELEISGGESSESLEASTEEPEPCCIEEEVVEVISSEHLDNSPVEILALTEGSLVDFVGCSKYLEAQKFICEELHVELPTWIVVGCGPMTLLVKEPHALEWNEYPLLLKPLYMRKKGSAVIIVFDTYD